MPVLKPDRLRTRPGRFWAPSTVTCPGTVFIHAALVVSMFANATGCVAQRSGSGAGSSAQRAAEPGPAVPEWAMVAKMQVVDAQMSLKVVETQAISELLQADLPERHLPAEQLANAALQNFQAGHATDAAVWLSLASYRYRQEWDRILSADRPGEVDSGSLPAVFYQLRNVELDAYRDLDFRLQLSALGQLLRGEEMVNWTLQERLADMYDDERADWEGYSEIARQKLSVSGERTENLITAKQLAKAYLSHLRASVEQGRYRARAVGARADVPLTPFALDALRSGFEDINPGYCSRFANQLSTRGKEVGTFLTDSNKWVRANAAIVLGMNPNPDQISGLERQWALEKDHAVQLTFAYALARHGQPERVRELTSALVLCPIGVCEEAMTLLHWLPRKFITELDPKVLVRLAGDVRQRLAVRSFAIAVLGEIGREKSLTPETRKVLLSVAQEKNRDLLHHATLALANDAGFSRELVLAALKEPSPAFGPLLKRLTRVATVQDLPILRQYMARFAAKPGAETDRLIEAAARLPGVDAEAQLLSWSDAHPWLRRDVALRLMARPKLAQSTEDHLASIADHDVRLIVSVIRRAPGSLGLLQGELLAVEPSKRGFAIFLAGLVRDPGTREQLWSLVNFRDDHLYPNDALFRHAAMSALLWIALDEVVAARTSAAAPSGRPTVAGARDAL